jgi:hypothetical protein
MGFFEDMFMGQVSCLFVVVFTDEGILNKVNLLESGRFGLSNSVKLSGQHTIIRLKE